MKLGNMIYRPATNWVTTALLAVFILGFGIVADFYVDEPGAPVFASETQETPAEPQAFLRLF